VAIVCDVGVVGVLKADLRTLPALLFDVILKAIPL
jgi:hypothetical protein